MIEIASKWKIEKPRLDADYSLFWLELQVSDCSVKSKIYNLPIQLPGFFIVLSLESSDVGICLDIILWTFYDSSVLLFSNTVDLLAHEMKHNNWRPFIDLIRLVETQGDMLELIWCAPFLALSPLNTKKVRRKLTSQAKISEFIIPRTCVSISTPSCFLAVISAAILLKTPSPSHGFSWLIFPFRNHSIILGNVCSTQSCRQSSSVNSGSNCLSSATATDSGVSAVTVS